MSTRKDERIVSLFQRGYSLDQISEYGVVSGWTREQAKQAAADAGLSLNWQGRIRTDDDGCYDFEELVAAGLDHAVVDIRRLAVKAQRARDDLRRALELQEEKDAEEVARRRAAQEKAAAERADPSNWAHGTWSGFIAHKTYKVPTCPECEAAADEKRAAPGTSYRERNTSHHKRRQPAVAA